MVCTLLVVTCAFAATELITRPDHSGAGSVLVSPPTGNPNGDPIAQCKVLALGALEMLAREDGSVLAELDAGHNPFTDFTAKVVRRNEAAFLAEARRSGAARARKLLLPNVHTDCRRAP